MFKTWQSYIGAMFIVAGLIVAVIGTLNLDNVIIILGVIVAAPGVYLFYRGWQGRGSYSGNYKVAKSKKDNGKGMIYPNCLIIRPKRIDTEYIDPEYLEDLPINAMVRHCFSGNKKLYLLEQEGLEDEKLLKDLELPDDDEDKISYNPVEFANVITMPLNKKYFEWSATIFQKIAIGLMVIVIIAEIIGLVILSGNPEEAETVNSIMQMGVNYVYV